MINYLVLQKKDFQNFTTFGWNIPNPTPFLNQSKKPSHYILDEYTISKIKQHSILDQKLYDYAKDLFQKRLCN